MLRFLLSVAGSLLPRRWLRDDGDALAGACELTGVAEAALGVLLFVDRFHAYRLARYLEVHAPLGSEYAHGETMVFGFTLLVGFCFTFAGFAASFLFFEGLFRAAGGVAGQHHGLTALWLLSLAFTRRARPRSTLPDVRTADGDGWIIESAQPRDWDELTTFAVGDAHFRLAGVTHAPLSGRDRYRLVPIPPSWIVRRLVRLD